MTVVKERGGMTVVEERGGMTVVEESGGMTVVKERGGMTVVKERPSVFVTRVAGGKVVNHTHVGEGNMVGKNDIIEPSQISNQVLFVLHSAVERHSQGGGRDLGRTRHRDPLRMVTSRSLRQPVKPPTHSEENSRVVSVRDLKARWGTSSVRQVGDLISETGEGPHQRLQSPPTKGMCDRHPNDGDCEDLGSLLAASNIAGYPGHLLHSSVLLVGRPVNGNLSTLLESPEMQREARLLALRHSAQSLLDSEEGSRALLHHDWADPRWCSYPWLTWLPWLQCSQGQRQQGGISSVQLEPMSASCS
uniref:Uncharacterized protein n=1 Tax=Timema monikensis TaxID=170555 RepID=A0A7R9HTD6_9NEOP|nr:unnamed protein product [Timema monikensis]